MEWPPIEDHVHQFTFDRASLLLVECHVHASSSSSVGLRHLLLHCGACPRQTVWLQLFLENDCMRNDAFCSCTRRGSDVRFVRRDLKKGANRLCKCKYINVSLMFAWYGMVWYGMVWYGMVWYGMVCCCCCCCEGTQHVPAGEIARQALPGQGAREQSAGVTLAGRVPTTTEGGGGGGVPPSVRGGRGACVAEGGTTCMCDPCSLPRCGGRARAPVRDGGGMGGGREGPPVREPAGPRLPLLLAASPPRQGRGLLPVRKRRRGVVGAGNMYGLFPCIPVPLCSVGAGRTADPCSGERGPGGTGECSWARGGRVVHEGGVPHGAGPEHGFAACCWSSGRRVGPRGGGGGGGVLPVCPGAGWARARRADPIGPAQAMRRGWRGAGLQGRGGGIGLGWARGLR